MLKESCVSLMISFFADKGIVTYLLKVLGKVFFKTMKLPLAANLSIIIVRSRFRGGVGVCC